MYAVVKTGAKQYRVSPGDTIHVEKLEGVQGKTVELNEVLLFVDNDEVQLGAPLISGAKVTAEILAQEKGDKITIFKYKRRKKYRRKMGHRQLMTKLRITNVFGPGSVTSANVNA